MFPFWDLIVAPLIEAAAPARIVEIGALRGDSTVRLLDQLGPDTELHVIDPAPQFDPVEHERRFAGRYVFHRGLSLDVLPTLSPVDVALIDGDHNYYTVFHELTCLLATSTSAERPAPLLVLHDVSWPYGRRDGYYDPSTIPAEHRQPCAQRGIERGNQGLLVDGGINCQIWNAEHEGGPRNGVLTAFEDFLAAHPGRYLSIVIDLFVGIAVAADITMIEGNETLSSAFDSLSGAETTERLRNEIAEALRDSRVGP